MNFVNRAAGHDRVVIRPAAPEDAAALLELKLALDDETPFMMLEPGERRETAAELAAHIAALARRGNCALLVADVRDALVGYVEAEGGAFARNRGCASIVLGVRQSWSGRGIGSALVREVVAWADRHDVHRLELTVRVDNARAIALYRRCGFEVEGTRRQALRVSATYADELWMARLRSPAAN